jgi:hypothetical protein
MQHQHNHVGSHHGTVATSTDARTATKQCANKFAEFASFLSDTTRIAIPNGYTVPIVFTSTVG